MYVTSGRALTGRCGNSPDAGPRYICSYATDKLTLNTTVVRF